MLGGLITCPERVLVSGGVETDGLPPVVSSLAFFGVSFSLPSTGGVFPTVHGVSAGAFSEGVGRTSGVKFSSDKYWTPYRDLRLGSLLYGNIMWLDVTLISSDHSVGLVIDDPV